MCTAAISGAECSSAGAEGHEGGCNSAVQGRKLATNRERLKPVTHSHTISANQAAGEMEEDGDGGGSGVGTFTEVPRSLSLAAAHEVSVRRSPARTRWLPGFQSLDPAHIMKGDIL